MVIISKLKTNYSNRLYGRIELGFSLKVSSKPLKKMLPFAGFGV
jgi:hypothetical protein